MTKAATLRTRILTLDGEGKRTVDRTPKPCLCPKADHQHGTQWAYLTDGCRCWQCVYEYNKWERVRYARRSAGTPGLVPADPVRAHIRAHMASGATIPQIAEAAGLTYSSLHGILYGGRGQVLARTADEIMAVELVEQPDPEDTPHAVVVPSIGARRRVQALTRIGWSQGVISEHSGVCVRTICELSWRPGILAGNHQAIIRTYDALWDKEPTATTNYQRAALTKIKRAAERRGWAPPLAWDDDTIDDPNAKPDFGAPPDTTEERRHLYDQGLSDPEIAAKVGATSDAIRLWRLRNGQLPANYGRRTA